MEESRSFSNSSKVIIYHGGSEKVEYPNVRIRGYAKDFGWGFYTTIIKKQAEKWSLKVKNIPTVSVYTYSESSNLKILKFDSMTEDWLDFIIFCRQGKMHDFDIVEGPMADDTIYDFITDYIEGIITREAFWVLSKFKYPTHQLSFHTAKALTCLKFIESYEVKKEENRNGITRV